MHNSHPTTKYINPPQLGQDPASKKKIKKSEEKHTVVSRLLHINDVLTSRYNVLCGKSQKAGDVGRKKGNLRLKRKRSAT